MREIASVRRSSYGPSSPTIGERGARTRQAILDASLALFAQKGFHATLIDDIATRVGISRAALYQYFASKEEIFTELAHTAGNDLIRVVRRLGPLGPTAQGFDNLHWWIGEWAWVQDKYATMFVEWAKVDSPRTPMHSHIGDFVHSYAVRMTQRLTQADLNGLAPEGAALAILAMMRRVNQYRAMRMARGLPDEAVLDTLAVTVQLALFPDTAADVLALADTGETTRRKVRVQHERSLDTVVHFESLEDRFSGRSERAMSTIRRLLDAGGQVIAERGFHATSVEDILKRASLGRGTFYKYFDDKLDLLQAQAAEAAGAVVALVDRFREIDGGIGDPAALRSWLSDFIACRQRYAGVFRTWSDGEPRDDTLQGLSRQVGCRHLRTFDVVLGSVERDYPFTVRAGSLVLMALLDQLVNYSVVSKHVVLTNEVLVDTLAAFIERGFLDTQAHLRPERSVGRDA